METSEFKTTFKSTSSDRSISFSTDDESSLILISRSGDTGTSIRLDAKDNVAMALAVLGVGRVTDRVEKRARVRTDYTEEQLIEFAVTNLRAAMLLREQNTAEEKQLTEDAFVLYKLAYPETDFSLDEFIHNERNKWVEKLQTLRFNKVTL